MKQIRNLFCIIFFATLLLFSLAACAANPEKEVVTSKNNGVMQDKIYGKEASENTDPVSIHWKEDFTSTDERVRFSVNIDCEVSPNARQVVEVAPHLLTEEDIRRVAEVLLGEVEFYERQPSSHCVYSKAQYQMMINRLSAYATRESLSELLGTSGADTFLEYVHGYIETWTKESESAPNDDPRIPCDWELKKQRHYDDHPVQIGNRPIDEDMDVLYANAEKEGIAYSLSVFRRTDGNPKLNSIDLMLSDGTGLVPVDMAIYRSMLCGTEKPTDEQVDAVKQKAQELLTQMELGQWEIVKCTAGPIETGIPGCPVRYGIHVAAEPLFNGVSVIEGQKIQSYKDSYAPEYQMTGANFVFSASGDIIDFGLISPVDVLEVPNKNVAVISTEELTEKCKQQLSLSDRAAYGLPEYFIEETEAYSGEKLLCNIKITDAEYGVGRVRVPNTDNNYYYIPVLAFRGTATYISDKTGSVYYDNTPANEDEKPPILLCINAIDGTIIQ